MDGDELGDVVGILEPAKLGGKASSLVHFLFEKKVKFTFNVSLRTWPVPCPSSGTV